MALTVTGNMTIHCFGRWVVIAADFVFCVVLRVVFSSAHGLLHVPGSLAPLTPSTLFMVPVFGTCLDLEEIRADRRRNMFQIRAQAKKGGGSKSLAWA